METVNQSLLIYPLGEGVRNRTDINIRDINSLKRGKFLTDQVVDFWLKYIQTEKLNPEILETVHVFSSLFYTYLLRGGTLLNRRRRGSIDIFLKKYLVFPVVIDSHWLLTIVCNAVQSPSNEEPSSKRAKTSENLQIQGENESSNFADSSMILVLDSYRKTQSTGYARSIAATIRAFLRTEWKVRRGTDFNFSLENMPLHVPDVPQQSNLWDCGIYLLQFFEAFFSKPPHILISNYINLPHDWIYAFTENIETDKREQIYQTILSLLKGKHGVFVNTCKFLPKNTSGLPVSGDISLMLSTLKNNQPTLEESRRTETAKIVKDFFDNYRKVDLSVSEINMKSPELDKVTLENAKTALGVDHSKPKTSVTVRFADGSRVKINLNLEQTVSLIREFICQLRPDFASRAFSLMTSFPCTEVDERLTIEAANLMNSVIIQKLK